MARLRRGDQRIPRPQSRLSSLIHPTYPVALGPVPEVQRERRERLLLHRRLIIVVVVRSIRLAPDLLEGLAAEAGVQAVVLGCSHYPLLQPFLEELIPSHVRLVDPAIGLATQLDNYLSISHQQSQKSVSMGNTRIFVTSDPLGFSTRSIPWLGFCPEVELVSLRARACFF